MPQFAFVARDSAGSLVTGELSAVNRAEATRMLRNDGKFVVRISEGAAKSEAAAPRANVRRKGATRSDDVITFTSQLAVMVDTGVSLKDALDACRNRSNSPGFAAALEDVVEHVEGGSEFSAALARHPRIFSSLLVSMVKASEASGTMGLMLQRAADFLVGQRELRKKIKGAVAYPIAMLSFAFGVTVFLMTWVLPKFAAIYAGKEASLPALTRYLMAISDGMRVYGIHMLIGAAGIAALLLVHFRRPAGQWHLDWIKLHLPALGKMFHQTYVARGLRTLGTMTQSGVTILEAVALTRSACGNRYYERMWDAAVESLADGKQLSDALAASGLLSPPVLQMIRAGERTGKLGPVLERIANHCEAELSVAVKAATAMLEPIIIVVLGSVVGALVIALLLPIFTISRAMHP
ncbi:MAG: type II secretion system F family protein [Phycisphaerae bacterium]|nr:type II secretion system F family protein [Phycisphaerae bacterium]